MLIDPQTWRELFEAVYEIHAAKSHADFATSVVSGMRKLVAADLTVFQVFDRAGGRLILKMFPGNPYTEEELAYYRAHTGENPLVAYYERVKDPQARRLSDVIELEAWLATDYYRACLARQNLRHCLGLPIRVDATTLVALSFNRRGPDFTPHDCELLDAFAPHLRLAWERHENPWASQRQLDAQQRLRELGLAPRESEVLFWMTEGKQNREIATILQLQLGTVQQYVAGILVKLGQENRHAATVFALGVLKRR